MALADAIARLKAMYAEDQPTGFIALEFLVSPEVLASAQPGSILSRALSEGERGIPRQGFAWLGVDNQLARIVELTRHEIQQSGDADRILTELLTEPTPSYLQTLETGGRQ